MKRIAFVFLITILGYYTANGQQISFGIKPSVLLLESKYIEKPSTFGLKLSSRYSYGFGITIKDQLNRLFAFQVEPRVVAKGFNLDFGGSAHTIYKNNYLSLPTLLFFQPIHNLNIELGPEFAYLINSKTKNNPNGSFYDYKSPYQKHFELSLISGISYSFFKRFDLGIRYGIALTPYENGKVIVEEDPFYTGIYSNINYKIYNRYFEFYLNTRILTKSKNN